MKFPSIDPSGTVAEFQRLGQAIADSAPSVASMNTFAVKLAGHEDFHQRIKDLITSMKAATDELREHRMINHAEPDEVVQYILQQPKHTWKGVTIYPDEAWRYEQKSDWMWWRQ